jgi:hypothetical protein
MELANQWTLGCTFPRSIITQRFGYHADRSGFSAVVTQLTAFRFVSFSFNSKIPLAIMQNKAGASSRNDS